MIGSTEIERAERTLQVVYGGDLGRQLEHLQVERAAVDNVIQHVWDVVDSRNPERASMSGSLLGGLNTGLVHMFLLGLIAGRNSIRSIE